MRFPLASQSYLHAARGFSSQRLINQYLEAAPPEARSPAVICATPGTTSFCDLGTGPLRGLHVSGSTLYAVSGTSVFSVNTAGTATNRGSVAPSQTYVDMIENATQLMIAAGTNGYTYTLATDVVAVISSASFPGARSTLFMDGYGLVVKPSSSQMNLSSLNDFSVYNALDFTTETTASDNTLAVRDDRKEFWVFGSQVIVPYGRTGVGTFPFERVNQAILEMGCLAQFSIAIMDNSYFWIGNREKEGGVAVWKARDYTPTRISTHAIEEQIESFSDISEAIAFTYMLRGHLLYVLNFPAQATFVYDAATGLWHEWQRFRENWCTFTHHVYFNGQHIVGGTNGVLYVLDPEAYTDAGTVIQRKQITPVYQADGKPLRVSRVELGLNAGIGLTTGQGSDPQIMLRFSKDAGRTWSNEYWRSPGKLGEYRNRCLWRNLGRSREWALEITYTEPTPYTIFEGLAEATVGT